MNNAIVQSIVSFFIATPIALVVIRILFKKSIISKIASLWLVSLIFLVTNTRISGAYPDTYPYLISMPVALIVIFFIAYTAYRIISRPLKKTMEELEKVASGDLTVEVSQEMLDRNDEMGVISRAVEKLSASFREIMQGMQKSFDTIGNMGIQLKQAASELAQSASLQAGNIEEISSSMEEMAGTIQNSNDHTQETQAATSVTAADLKTGSEAALKAIEYLNEVTEKVAIISDIAYQTNILALNAGVEAARAGDSGRGFSVVAKQVRLLSDQSKLAAGEIDEVSRISSDYSSEAIERLKVVVPEMEKINQLIEKIAMAASEQNAGVQQINNAIQEMNQATQINASNAEEMAQSAATLTDEAVRLQQLMAYFKTDR